MKWWKVPGWAPVGLVRMARGIVRWANDSESEEHWQGQYKLRQERYNKLRQERAEIIARRRGLVIAFSGVACIAIWAADRWAGSWTWQAAALVLLLVAFHIGRPVDAPPLLRLPAPALTNRGGVTAAGVADALASAVPEIQRALKDDAAAVRFPDPPARQGNGWHVRAELPPGVTYGMVAAQQQKLASALRRPTLAVAIDPDPAHAGMVSLWVGDSAPSGHVTWPLADGGTVDILDEFPIGEDLRGRPVTLTLRNQNVLIGAQPGYGKTVMLRVVLLAAALDPRTLIYAYDLKGGVDLLPLEGVAARVVAGDEDDELRQLRDDLAAVQAEISRRNKMLRSLPVTERPDGQITSADATRLGLSPIVFAIDEAQFAYQSTEFGKEIERLTADVFRRGRSVGIHVLLSTQRFDTLSVPRSVSSNATVRMCGRVDSFQESNMILGSNAHGAGVTATIFGDSDRGVMWSKGSGPTKVVRGAMVTAGAAWAIAARAAGARAAAVPLEEPAAEALPAHDVIGRVLSVWPDGEPAVWSDTLLGLLQGGFPGEYGDHSAASLSRLLPVPARQVKKDGQNKRGYRLAELTASRVDKPHHLGLDSVEEVNHQ